MNTFAIGSLPVHFSVAKLFNFRWQYTRHGKLHIQARKIGQQYEVSRDRNAKYSKIFKNA